MTHDELVIRAEKWLRGTKHCGVVLAERRCGGAHEIPDAIGWAKSFWSILVECKTTRSDFFRDRDKMSRRLALANKADVEHGREPFGGDFGMGQRRYYMTPEGLVRPDELPPGWGLVEAGTRCCKVVVESPEKGFDHWRCRYELALLYSAMRRVQLGIEPTFGVALGEMRPRRSDEKTLRAIQQTIAAKLGS